MTTGRKPLATAIKESRGSLKKNPQRRNKHEPQAIAGRPGVPSIVASDSAALAKWNHLCDVLDELGLLATSDGDLMAVYSVTWAKWVSMVLAVREEGEVINGKANPKQYEANKAADRLFKIGAEFGLSPSSRSRLSAAPKEEDDPFLKYLNGE